MSFESKNFGDINLCCQIRYIEGIDIQHYLFSLHLYPKSYAGEHYSVSQLGQVSLHLNRTTNGMDWEPVGQSPFYIGGISEVGEYFCTLIESMGNQHLSLNIILTQVGPSMIKE